MKIPQSEVDECARLRQEGTSQNGTARIWKLTRNQVRERLAVADGVENSGPKAGNTYRLGGDPKDRRILAQAAEKNRVKNEPQPQQRATTAGVVRRNELNGVNEFKLAIMEGRLRRYVERTIRLSRELGPGNYPGIVVKLI